MTQHRFFVQLLFVISFVYGAFRAYRHFVPHFFKPSAGIEILSEVVLGESLESTPDVRVAWMTLRHGQMIRSFQNSFCVAIYQGREKSKEIIWCGVRQRECEIKISFVNNQIVEWEENGELLLGFGLKRRKHEVLLARTILYELRKCASTANEKEYAE